MDSVVIPNRFRGPPESGNGGYAAGSFAAFVGGPAEVTLRLPPPLERPIAIERTDDEVRAMHEGQLIAEARSARPEVDALKPVSYEEAEEALRSFTYGVDHPFPHCFVCGPARAPGDGLRIFAAPVGTEGVLAAPWIPADNLADDQGAVDDRFAWASLDCPSGFAAFAGRNTLTLLGRLTAEIVAPVRSGERCVVLGWPLGHEGRKLHAASALYGEDGVVRAIARATWIEIAGR